MFTSRRQKPQHRHHTEAAACEATALLLSTLLYLYNSSMCLLGRPRRLGVDRMLANKGRCDAEFMHVELDRDVITFIEIITALSFGVCLLLCNKALVDLSASNPVLLDRATQQVRIPITIASEIIAMWVCNSRSGLHPHSGCWHAVQSQVLAQRRDAAPLNVSDTSSLHVNSWHLLRNYVCWHAISDGSGHACTDSSPRYPVACSKPYGPVMNDAGTPLAYLPARPPACLLACASSPHPHTQHPMHVQAHRWQLHQGSPSQGAAHSAQRAQLSHSCSCCVGLRGPLRGQAVLLGRQYCCAQQLQLQLALAVGLRGRVSACVGRRDRLYCCALQLLLCGHAHWLWRP
jgi:hypothetical protein